ncbi:MAG: hypothetical protein ABIP48_08360 [Planctomycetota bacterium]
MTREGCVRLGLGLILGVALCLAPRICRAEDPAWYTRRETWRDTMRASLRTIEGPAQSQEAAVFKPFSSDVLCGGEPARHVRLRVTGVKSLSLIAKGVPHGNAHLPGKTAAVDGSTARKYLEWRTGTHNIGPRTYEKEGKHDPASF